MAAVNSEHGGCEPKPPDRCESSFSGPGIKISGPGRLSKGSSHSEAPSNQSVDDKLKYMPMEDFKVLLNVLHEARKDKSKLKSANSEQAEIISELEHHSKGPSNPEEPIQSLNAKFTSSLQSLSHPELNSSPKRSTQNYSSSSTNSNTISCETSSSSSSSSAGVGSGYNSGDQITNQFNSSTITNSNVKSKPVTVPYSITLYNKNNNNNFGLNSRMGSEPLIGGVPLMTAHDDGGPSHPNHNSSTDLEIEDVEEESPTPIQYFFTTKDDTQQLIDAAEAEQLSNSTESDGLPDYYPGESHSSQPSDVSLQYDSKDEFGNRNTTIQPPDDYSLSGPGGRTNLIDVPRPTTPTQYSSGVPKNADASSGDRVSRFRANERASKNKRKPPKGETSVRQEELPGFVGDQKDIEKLVQFVEGRTSMNKKNTKEKKQREVRSKSKEKEALKQAVTSSNICPTDLYRKPSLAESVMPSTEPVEEEEKPVEIPIAPTPKREAKIIEKEKEHPVSNKVDEDKQINEEGSGYTLVKKKRKPKTRTTPSKDSFQRGDETRREPARSRRSGGSRRKSVGSVPGSENSASDGEDSVKSLPAVCSSSEKVPKPCISSGGTPQTSYAEIVRIARDEERKKYGSCGSWMKAGEQESINIDEFPDMTIDSAESPSSRVEKLHQSDVGARIVKGISTISSAVESSIDKNSSETCRNDSSNDNFSVAHSVSLNEPLVPSTVPTSKVSNTNVDRRNNSNEAFNTLNVAKSRHWPNNAGSRDTRTLKSNDEKSSSQVLGQSCANSVQSKGSVRSGAQQSKVDTNSYLAKAAQNVGPSTTVAGNSPGLASSPDVGFPALVSSESLSPPSPMTQGPWSTRLKTNPDKSTPNRKEVSQSGDKMSTNSSFPSKQVNGLAGDHKEVNKSSRSQTSNPSAISPTKKSSSSTVGKESPKFNIQSPSADKNDKSAGQEDVASSKGRKDDSNKNSGDVIDSLNKKTENMKINCDQTPMKRLASHDSFKTDGGKSSGSHESSKGQKSRKDFSKRRHSYERNAERDKDVDKVKKSDQSSNVERNNERSGNADPPIVNGDASECEISKLMSEPDVPEDCKSLCSEKSYISSDTHAMPVVFCGENFKETPNCLPDKSCGYEFGFDLNDVLDSAYANTQAITVESVPEVADEDFSTEKTIAEDVEESLVDISCCTVDGYYGSSIADGRQSPKSVVEDGPTPPPVELIHIAVRPNQNHPNSTPHNSRHKHSSSSTYHRNYQYVPSQQYMPMPQPGGPMPRNVHMIPPGQYIPSQPIPRGASSIQNYPSAPYPPSHLQGPGVSQMNVPVYNLPPPINMTSGIRPIQDYHLAAAMSMPTFGVGMYSITSKAAGDQGVSQGNSHDTAYKPFRYWEAPKFPSGVDIAQFFVPLPPNIAPATERGIQKFMDQYVKKLNELCRTGRIKFHRL